MQIQRNGFWGAAGLRPAGMVNFLGMALFAILFGAEGAWAEDVQLEQVTRKRNVVRQPAPRPAVPRPIQDETTRRSGMSSGRPVRKAKEEAVDLDALTSSGSTSGSSSASGSGSLSPHGGSTGGMAGSSSRNFHGPSAAGAAVPNFKFYYDFLLRSWRVGASTNNVGSFTFESYHQRLLVEFTPKPELQFMADVLNLSFFEVDYQMSPGVQLRWGRIWIPFDDMSPHSVFGGRMNTSEFFQTNETAFLPNIWADLGMGLKFSLADSAAMTSVLHLYAVNGFQDGGDSPVENESPSNVHYPNFSGTSGGTGDNNNAKAFGARLHNVFGRKFGLGLSAYRDAYTNKNAPSSQSITMIGADVQLRPTATTDIRLGYVGMKVGIVSYAGQPPTAKESFSRGGTYIELGQKFGAENRWKFLARAGAAQNDNRVVDVSDKTIVGATLLRNFDILEAQLSYWRDLKQVPSKVAYNYGAFRLVTAF